MKNDNHINSMKEFVPTAKQSYYLSWLQDNDCAKLYYMREEVAEAVCLLAKMSMEVDDDIAEEAFRIMKNLGHIHYELKIFETEE
ncbi:MAG: hypothetical protein GZ094_01255 [Mariniphaga sp.]|nr:hypothetical protein [Mariniphaga sp.]